jgi:hypothetical protein
MPEIAADKLGRISKDSCAQPIESKGLRESFPTPLPLSQLRPEAAATGWLLHGIIRPAAITLLTALWKCGKTTWLAHLFAALHRGGEFCGLPVDPARVLVITEEPADLWIERRDGLGIGDHVEALIRPLRGRPSCKEWLAFIDNWAALTAERQYQLVVIDPLPNFWPVWDENDAAQVIAALTPLRCLTDAGAAVLLNMHPRKSDGAEGTAPRGSGALSAFPDILIEMRRMCPADHRDRRRVLTGLSRYRETPAELVIELSAEGDQYTALGDRAEAKGRLRSEQIDAVLPDADPGLTADEVLDALPDVKKPGKRSLEIVLSEGVNENRWLVSGEGKKGDPHRYRRPAPDAGETIRTPFDREPSPN